jgi:transcriptional regulator with XRE-family HTH domain
MHIMQIKEGCKMRKFEVNKNKETYMLNIQLLKAILKDRKMTQNELATRLGVNQSTISRWFQGGNIPQKYRNDICSILNINDSHLHTQVQLVPIVAQIKPTESFAYSSIYKYPDELGYAPAPEYIINTDEESDDDILDHYYAIKILADMNLIIFNIECLIYVHRKVVDKLEGSALAIYIDDNGLASLRNVMVSGSSIKLEDLKGNNSILKHISFLKALDWVTSITFLPYPNTQLYAYQYKDNMIKSIFNKNDNHLLINHN